MKMTFGGIWVCALLAGMAFNMAAAEPAWNPATVKECDRACLVDYMDRYMNAVYKKDKSLLPPLARDVRLTENTGQMDIGEGVIWRMKVEPTTFNLYVADPVQGQVSLQARLKIQGRDALVAIRLRIDRGQILEIEELYDRNINAAAIPLLTTPRPTLVADIPPSERLSREMLLRAANSYFDALKAMTERLRRSPMIACATRTDIRL
jgi:hypothetical protein